MANKIYGIRITPAFDLLCPEGEIWFPDTHARDEALERLRLAAMRRRASYRQAAAGIYGITRPADRGELGPSAMWGGK